MPTPNDNVSANWFEQAFDTLYPIVYAHRSVDAAAPEVAFAIKALCLRPQHRVLDVACGNGRHLVHLAANGNSVMGLDFSPALLALATERFSGNVPLLRADMRTIPFRAAFDVVTSFFTSFGYFTTHAENLAVAQGISVALKPGGAFFIDFINREHVVQTLVPESVRHHEDYEIRDRRWIDAETDRLNKATEVFRAGECLVSYEESVQLYTHEAFDGLLREGGLQPDTYYGDYDGSQLDVANPRMMAVGYAP
jgi:SAM-dependent methyltransferase